ncbi:TRAM domain-containing protein [Salinirubrum litoreum]|uniref:TRAM domain-containing protein n=1 Tax=Salinirubrum litoreum TaxID=1126234 RepID=A0ABD5RGI4_9EURY|nr:TRAM domain-containing protein [Salinirubrum litoreum]
MQLSTPLCLFTGRIERENGEYVLTIPEQEIDLGTLEADEIYRVGVYPTDARTGRGRTHEQNSTVQRPLVTHGTQRAEKSVQDRGASDTSPSSDRSDVSINSQPDQPPVTEGETLEVEIEGMGEKGDGLAKVGPGYVVFVSDTEIGQQPLVRVTTARENFAFAEVVEQ